MISRITKNSSELGFKRGNDSHKLKYQVLYKTIYLNLYFFLSNSNPISQGVYLQTPKEGAFISEFTLGRSFMGTFRRSHAKGR